MRGVVCVWKIEDGRWKMEDRNGRWDMGDVRCKCDNCVVSFYCLRLEAVASEREFLFHTKLNMSWSEE